MSSIRFSIITCFHNSAHRLDNYFAALRALDVSGRAVEFIFVDNASRDDTKCRLADESARMTTPACVLSEPTPGLMFARCIGVAAAQGEFILFLDDDNEPAPDYLVNLDRLLANYPQAVMFTGNVSVPVSYPVNDGNRQILIMLAVRDIKGEFVYQLTELYPPHIAWGVGLFARRTDLAAAIEAWRSGNRRIIGRCAGKLSGGEDIWLAHYLTQNGQTVVFSDQLRIVHRFDPSRLGPTHLGQLALEAGLEHLALLDSLLLLKPQLKYDPVNSWHLLKNCFLRLPLRIGLCLWRLDTTSLALAAFVLGYVYSLLFRCTCQRNTTIS